MRFRSWWKNRGWSCFQAYKSAAKISLLIFFSHALNFLTAVYSTLSHLLTFLVEMPTAPKSRGGKTGKAGKAGKGARKQGQRGADGGTTAALVAPRRPRSAYMLFANTQRAKIKGAKTSSVVGGGDDGGGSSASSGHGGGGGSISRQTLSRNSFAALNREIAERWWALGFHNLNTHLLKLPAQL